MAAGLNPDERINYVRVIRMQSSAGNINIITIRHLRRLGVC